MSYLRAFTLTCLLGLLVFGQTRPADAHVKQLLEHWRWKQYWYGTTELGALYRAGREFGALFFWRIDETPPSVGLCSADLGICQFYADTTHIDSNSEAKVAAADDSRSAFNRFLRTSFGRTPFELARLPKINEADYATEVMMIVLPALDPPEPIRNRKMRPSGEIEALKASLGCRVEQVGCKTHLLIPFYSESDPYIPVYYECSKCASTKPVIIFMKLIEGNWWHGAMDYDASPDSVDRTRRQIEKALMAEVRR